MCSLAPNLSILIYFIYLAPVSFNIDQYFYTQIQNKVYCNLTKITLNSQKTKRFTYLVSVLKCSPGVIAFTKKLNDIVKLSWAHSEKYRILCFLYPIFSPSYIRGSCQYFGRIFFNTNKELSFSPIQKIIKKILTLCLLNLVLASLCIHHACVYEFVKEGLRCIFVYVFMRMNVFCMYV